MNIYDAQSLSDPGFQIVMDELQKHAAKEFGISRVGNRLTLRWTNEQGRHVHVSCIITEVYTPYEAAEAVRKLERLKRMDLDKKYPELAGEQYFIEHGEWPK
jgi:hypothetical protein